MNSKVFQELFEIILSKVDLHNLTAMDTAPCCSVSPSQHNNLLHKQDGLNLKVYLSMKVVLKINF